MISTLKRFSLLLQAASLLMVCCVSSLAQMPQAAKIERGSETARAGFSNENAVAEKFINWRFDSEARNWLESMSFRLSDVTDVAVSQPRGEKADIVVAVTTAAGTFAHGVSIKLVSSQNGFNQIDKRWLRQYAAAWKMPPDIVSALRFFTGEAKPDRPSRNATRMFINEFDTETQQKIVEFFTANKEMIVSHLLEGDGNRKAKWFLVAWKNADKPKWTLRSIGDTTKFFGEGKVEITRTGNLKIGRITMQRKGGDGGRETARMLQFKLNPTLLFGLK